MNKTFVIAEAGSCHGGDLNKALKLIEVAKRCGADACKFQWVSSAHRLAERRKAFEYEDQYKYIEFPIQWHQILFDKCREQGIEYMCTVYLPGDFEVIDKYVQRFKISSFEAKDFWFMSLLWPIAGAGAGRERRQVIVSTGMFSEADLIRQGDIWYDYLYCISSYPTPLGELNLANLLSGGYRGLSDHTTATDVGALAVAAGAEIIEKHFRLFETNQSNADYAVALDPNEFLWYVDGIRRTEMILGEPGRKRLECEDAMRKYRRVTGENA